MAQINGHISQIIGPVIDVYFDTAGQKAEEVLPKIHEALKLKRPNGQSSSLKCSSTSEKTPCDASQWTIPMDCSEDWKSFLREMQSLCRQASKSRVE